MKYINNDPTQGINYDWRKIMQFYKKLGVPAEYDYSDILPLDKPYKWHLLLSVKSVGKTTQLLLIGLIMYRLYGTCIQLVRHHMDNAAYYNRLFTLINTFDGGRYLKTIFGDENLEVGYYSKFFHVYKRLENGKREKYYPDPCAVALGSDECYTLCSKYDAPKGDLIILDECFTNMNRPDEFLNFINLHKTIVRERLSDKIFVLGNTYDANNIWFRQLTIARQIRGLKPNDQRVFKTVDEMEIFVYYLTPRSPEKRMNFNKLHYGFGNPQLNAITGAGAWNSKIYPLITQLPNKKTKFRGMFFKIYDDLYLECEYVVCDLGDYYFIHPARISTAQMSKLVFTNTFCKNENELLFGNDKISKRIITAIHNKRIVFSDNESGNLFEKFINERSL